MPAADAITLQILDTTKPDVGPRKGPGFTYPRWSAESKPYWDGCMRGELLCDGAGGAQKGAKP